MAAQLDEVREANRAFYRAFESFELERMEAVWAHDGLVTCAHPGWALVEGWAAVRESWATVFANTPRIRFTVDDERIDARGGLGWVVCTERIRSEDASGAVLATNVFRRGDDGLWRMVHHHGSPVPQPRAGRTAPPPKTRVVN